MGMAEGGHRRTIDYDPGMLQHLRTMTQQHHMSTVKSGEFVCTFKVDLTKIGMIPPHQTYQTHSKYPPVIKHGNGRYTMKIGDVPIETPSSSGFPIATFDYQRVIRIKIIRWRFPQKVAPQIIQNSIIFVFKPMVTWPCFKKPPYSAKVWVCLKTWYPLTHAFMTCSLILTR